jgi:hypothetical protein
LNDLRTGKEEAFQGQSYLEHCTQKFINFFNDPNIEPWDELYLTDINPNFNINYQCLGDESMWWKFDSIAFNI